VLVVVEVLVVINTIKDELEGLEVEEPLQDNYSLPNLYPLH